MAARARRTRLRQDRSRIRAARAFPRTCLRRLPFRAHRTDAADPGIPPAVPDRPIRFAGFRDRHCPERHGRGRGDALRSFQPRGGVRGRNRRRAHPYALSRRPRPCRVERQIRSPAKHDGPGTHLTNGCAIVLAEVSNRLMVANKPARQPHLSFPKIISARSSGAVRRRSVATASASSRGLRTIRRGRGRRDRQAGPYFFDLAKAMTTPPPIAPGECRYLFHREPFVRRSDDSDLLLLKKVAKNPQPDRILGNPILLATSRSYLLLQDRRALRIVVTQQI